MVLYTFHRERLNPFSTHTIYGKVGLRTGQFPFPYLPHPSSVLPKHSKLTKPVFC